MTPRLKPLHLRVKGAAKAAKSGVTFEIPTVTRMASRLVLNRGGRGRDAADRLIAPSQGELRRVAQAAKMAVTS